MKERNGKNRPHVFVVGVILLLGVFVCPVFVSSPALAQSSPPVITFDAPGAGTTRGQGTWATAINAGGVIAGYYADSGGACHGFVRNTDGTYISFDTPLGTHGAPTCPQPSSINAAGAITGGEYDRSFACADPDAFCAGTHGFIRMPDGTITVFDGPVNPSFEHPGTFPMGINSTNTVVGQYMTCDQGQCSTSFVRTPDGTFSTFDTPGATPYDEPRPVGIITSGTIAGTFAHSNLGHGYLRAPDGAFIAVDAPGAALGANGSGGTSLSGINSTGEVTGYFTDANSVVHGYVRAPDGTFTTFDVPGSASTGGASINDRGTVVGTYATTTPSGPYNFHGFLRAADGTFTTFDGPVQSFALSSGISSSNEVAGYYTDANSVTHSFLRPGTPGISSFTPNNGAAATTVTITGANFTGATRVAFNRVAANFSVDSDTQITATVPAGATTGSLSVTTPWGTGWSFSGTPFTVDSEGTPTITSFSPASGSTGWTVALTGTNFTGTTGVSFNGTPATTMWATSDTQFNAKVPSGATSGPITLTNSLGSAVSASSFTVTPHISSFTPTSGTMGTTVTITGTSFTGATAVTFFRVPANFTVVSDTQITATVPGGALSGWISVKTANGTLWSSSNFTPTSAGAPTISSFSPGSGTAGATITLTGTNFTGTTGVSINGTAATTFWATSDTQLNVKIPSGATSGPITVTNTAGTTSSASSLTVH